VQRERDAILDCMARLEVESAAAARAGKAAERERGERLVEADMCRLEVRRLRTLLGRRVLRGRAGGLLGGAGPAVMVSMFLSLK
jgi:hypothetical protein